MLPLLENLKMCSLTCRLIRMMPLRQGPRSQEQWQWLSRGLEEARVVFGSKEKLSTRSVEIPCHWKQHGVNFHWSAKGFCLASNAAQALLGFIQRAADGWGLRCAFYEAHGVQGLMSRMCFIRGVAQSSISTKCCIALQWGIIHQWWGLWLLPEGQRFESGAGRQHALLPWYKMRGSADIWPKWLQAGEVLRLPLPLAVKSRTHAQKFAHLTDSWVKPFGIETSEYY